MLFFPYFYVWLIIFPCLCVRFLYYINPSPSFSPSPFWKRLWNRYNLTRFKVLLYYFFIISFYILVFSRLKAKAKNSGFLLLADIHNAVDFHSFCFCINWWVTKPLSFYSYLPVISICFHFWRLWFNAFLGYSRVQFWLSYFNFRPF